MGYFSVLNPKTHPKLYSTALHLMGSRGWVKIFGSVLAGSRSNFAWEEEQKSGTGMLQSRLEHNMSCPPGR